MRCLFFKFVCLIYERVDVRFVFGLRESFDSAVDEQMRAESE